MYIEIADGGIVVSPAGPVGFEYNVGIACRIGTNSIIDRVEAGGLLCCRRVIIGSGGVGAALYFFAARAKHYPAGKNHQKQYSGIHQSHFIHLLTLDTEELLVCG
jgi:hypothetical protein